LLPFGHELTILYCGGKENNLNQTKIESPDYIKDIFNKAGCHWSEDDFDQFITWLYQDKLEYLLQFTLSKLGYDTQPEDAEDILSDFIAKHLNPVINGYDPINGCYFWNYFLICLERLCFKKGKRIRDLHQTEVPLVTINIEEEIIEFALTDNNITPEEDIICEGLSDAINKAGVLSNKEKMAFELFYIEGLSIKEIAEKLSISMPNVKVCLYRVRKKLSVYLGKKGW
jgi:RNA polymerase sigma factor (sigma-70 family)